MVKPSGFKEKIASIFGERKTVSEQTIWKGVVDSLPQEFHAFIFGEPVKSIGTTFCIWRKQSDKQWNIGNIQFPVDDYKDGSADMLSILDNDPATYQKWAMECYEDELDDRKLKLELVKHIYDSKPVNRTIVLEINPNLQEFDTLKADFDEIGYQYHGI